MGGQPKINPRADSLAMEKPKLGPWLMVLNALFEIQRLLMKREKHTRRRKVERVKSREQVAAQTDLLSKKTWTGRSFWSSLVQALDRHWFRPGPTKSAMRQGSREA